MNFIRKNIIFAIVCSVTLIVSGYLIFLDIMKRSEIVAANETATSNRSEGENIYKRGANRPVPENASKIRTDAEEMRKRAKELQLIFGNIYREALQEFSRKVGIPEQQLLRSFRELYDAEKEKTGGAKVASELVPLFFKKLVDESQKAWDEAKKLPEKERPKNLKLLTDKQIDDALYAFADLAVREDLEDLRVVDRAHVRQSVELINVFASALGLPREMGDSLAANYLAASQNIIEKQHLIPGVKDKMKIKELTFAQFEARLPDKNEISQILETMPILVDIFRRMQESRIEKLVTFTRFESNVSEKYKKYTFRCSVESSFDSVRNFCACLQAASAKNRVYVVRWVALESIAKQTEVSTIQSYIDGSDRKTATSNDRRGNETAKVHTVRVRTEAESNSDPHYGEPVIGLNKNVIAEIDFDYYIYLGNRIKKDQQ